MLRTFTELCRYDGLRDRFEYLRLDGSVGESTFGYDRWMNQLFYKSREWRQVRDEVIVRDMGLDLGTTDTPLRGSPYIHHMNPLTPRDIAEGSDNLLNPEYLITVSHSTHNAIHYGNEELLPRPFVERRPGDTRLW